MQVKTDSYASSIFLGNEGQCRMAGCYATPQDLQKISLGAGWWRQEIAPASIGHEFQCDDSSPSTLVPVQAALAQDYICTVRRCKDSVPARHDRRLRRAKAPRHPHHGPLHIPTHRQSNDNTRSILSDNYDWHRKLAGAAVPRPYLQA